VTNTCVNISFEFMAQREARETHGVDLEGVQACLPIHSFDFRLSYYGRFYLWIFDINMIVKLVSG
jgi:hypothetical protein